MRHATTTAADSAVCVGSGMMVTPVAWSRWGRIFTSWPSDREAAHANVRPPACSKLQWTVRNVHCLATAGTRTPYGISHTGVTCHPADVTFPPLPPTKAGSRFSDPGEMQGLVDLGTAVKCAALGTGCTPLLQCLARAKGCISQWPSHKHNRPRWDSNLGPVTPQSLDQCDLQYSPQM